MKKHLLILIILLLPISVFAYSESIIPGGENIGITIDTNGLIVVGFYKVNGEYIGKRELVSIEDEKKNRLMLNLRLLKGINLNEWFLKYGENLEANENIKKLIKDKYMKIENNYLFINPKKLYVMNEILIRLI